MRDLGQIIKAYDVRAVYPDQLDDSLAHDIGAAFVRVVGAAGGSVVVGHDMRPSSAPLVAAFTSGATSQGADVVHVGLVSTDALSFAAGYLDMPGAMFTASHNPARYNGIKLCRAGAVPVGRDTVVVRHPSPARGGRPAARRSVGHGDGARPAQRLRRLPQGARRPVRHPPAHCRRRRGQRHGRPHGTGRVLRPSPDGRAALLRSRRDISPTTRPTRSTRPTCATCRPR